MIEKYLTDKEYETYFSSLNGLRRRIARVLPIKSGIYILDIATGYGFYSLEIAERGRNLKITGIDITKSNVENTKRDIEKRNFGEKIEVIQMDATEMGFPDKKFDMVVNFLGLEDIHMTRGKDGVQNTFNEANRVLKSDRFFCSVIMPTDEMETEAQRTEVALFSYICDATWLNYKEYEEMLARAKFKIVEKKHFFTGRKLTPDQAKVEIKFACREVPKIYGIYTPSFEDVWERFGNKIEENGLGQCSRVLLIIAQKTGHLNS
jgi:ubiquinone/menaquinone biosynthesis C-methylase UbiE